MSVIPQRSLYGVLAAIYRIEMYTDFVAENSNMDAFARKYEQNGESLKSVFCVQTTTLQ